MALFQAYLAVLSFTNNVFWFSFNKLEGRGNPGSSKLLVPFFQQHLLTCVSVSHFGNSHKISKFFIIIISVRVIDHH